MLSAESKVNVQFNNVNMLLFAFIVDIHRVSGIFEKISIPFLRCSHIVLFFPIENYWIIPENKLKKKYEFKIQAENLNGLSDFSKESDEFDFSVAYRAQADIVAIILGVIISLVLVVFIGIALCAWCMYISTYSIMKIENHFNFTSLQISRERTRKRKC